uniref:VIT family protein n=1 Tax=candidate division WWE3 bacterium TaxID=2053526 RepID=A0A831YPY4_UNCKA
MRETSRLEELNHRKLDLRDIILGGQDGLVNVLGVTLGLAAAAADTSLIIAGGLAATFAESLSMAAVAYTSSFSGGHALTDAGIVGFSAVLGSFIPLFPFVFLSPSLAMLISVSVSAVFLFGLGIYKARVLGRGFLKGGLEILTIGLTAALVGYLVGLIFRVPTV